MRSCLHLGRACSVKLPQVKKDFLAAANSEPKSPVAPALKLNPPQKVAVAANPNRGRPQEMQKVQTRTKTR